MHKHKSKSKSHRWGAWSEWTWDSTQQANVRVRQDTEGHLEYEWEQQDLNPAGHARNPLNAAVEDITERLNSLTTTNEADYWSRPRGYAAFGEASAASSSRAAAEAQLYTGEDFEVISSKIGSAHSGSEGSPTPQAETAAYGEYIPGAAEGDAGELDPRYRIEHSTRFQPGEIFKVHWPILTYGGKACKKSGVKPEKHGIVYERGQKSKKLDGEPPLGFSPVRVEMTEEGEKISRESRVNYSKLVTVEHNVKVFFIGHVYASDWQMVGDAVNHHC
ncbi:hypothetical protein MY11210_003156 [Beauveria gryllotalpidicola]